MSLDAFMPVLTEAVLEAGQKLTGTFAALDAVYKHFDPAAVRPEAGGHKTVNIPVPVPMTAVNIGSNGFTSAMSAADAVTKSITYDKHPAIGYTISDFDQFRSKESIRDTFLDQAIKGVAEFANNDICALFTTGNFPTYAVINNATTAGGQTLTQTNINKAWKNLARGKVPRRDYNNLWLLTHPDVYGNMLLETSLTDEGKAGIRYADDSRRRAEIGQLYGFQVWDDIQMPANPSLFTTAGDDIFTAAAFHSHAIGLATRPLPAPDANVVKHLPLDFKGLKLRVMIGYSHEKDGWVVTVDAGYGVGVIRPEMCTLLTSGV